MRTPRVIILAAFLFTSLTLTYLSLRSSHIDDAAATTTEPKGGLRTFLSFQTPLSLFPPNAIISLTDDNTTSFLARPAAFGPLLPSKGLSGQLWIGSGFGDDSLKHGAMTSGAEGELGCSDVPGWVDGNAKAGPIVTSGRSSKAIKTSVDSEKKKGEKRDGDQKAGEGREAVPYYPASDAKEYDPLIDDGTDDYLHRSVSGSAVKTSKNEAHDISTNAKGNHADIQSIQEGAEIAGKIVILSRGGCGFLEKVKWVQRRGGIALIVGDDTVGGPLIQMYARGDTSNVTIPSVFTSHTTAHLLSSLIPPGSYTEDTIDEDGNVAVKVQQSNKPSKETKKGKKQGSKSNSQLTAGAPKATSTPRPKSSPGKKKPSTTVVPTADENPSWIRSWFTKSSDAKSGSDSKSAKAGSSSDWVLVTDWNEDEDTTKNTPTNQGGGAAAPKKPATSKSEAKPANGDDFVIGVQDWRDPDLVTTPGPQDNAASSKDAHDSADQKPPARILHTPPANAVPGASLSSEGSDSGSAKNAPEASVDSSGSDSDNRGFLYRLFGDDDDESQAVNAQANNYENSQHDIDDESIDEHEGLWVTLTPTSAASPFLDTLLVLVVSPLVTLTVVYALLFLRSRIRRRRWRAPKSVVERLPVRTYQTISPSTAPSRQPSPTTSSPTTPLLQQTAAAAAAVVRPRPRSRTTSGLPEPRNLSRSNSDLLSTRAPPRTHEHEKQASSPSAWKKYMGKQVECVVCLEEYIDGVSRVMSLPCGHEFHADCITPWLTTRRRTCPICKGDVVRSLARGSQSSSRYDAYHDDSDDDIQTQAAESINESPSAALPIFRDADNAADADLEQGAVPPAPPTAGRNARPSSWRNILSGSLRSLSRSPRPPQPDRSR
ncbi:MAG: hypothetical protein M1818_004832 [Claussenomyces sp. TS43310]|nr:MAG: hypothetical protein M1818_004832 [Claussenomyces sp. TS43310]